MNSRGFQPTEAMRGRFRGLTTISLATALFAFAVASSNQAGAAPSISIYTDRSFYTSGDTIELSLSGANHGEPMNVDVYVGLIAPDDIIYCLTDSGWAQSVSPWVSDINIPLPFLLHRTPFLWLALPCSMPPIEDPGEYAFGVLLTLPSSFDWLTGLDLAPLTLRAPGDVNYYVDGEAGDNSNDGSQSAPWKTITYALGSVEGSERNHVAINVAAGTYAASTNGESFPLSMENWVSLVGSGAEITFLDAENSSSRVIQCTSVSDLSIERLTIANGGEYDSGTTGGGILCTKCSPRIRGNIITGNLAQFGAGIYCCEGSWPTIDNNIIYNNTAGSHSSDAGGGIYCDSYSAPKIVNNLIVANSAARGGGIYYHAQRPPTIANNTISENLADFGNGIYCRAIGSTYQVEAPAEGAASREADDEGEQDGEEPNIRDCIIWGNGGASWAEDDDDGLYRDLYCCSAVYSCIEEEEEGEGNTHEDPMFVTGPYGGYYLDPQSPCVDSGSAPAESVGLENRTTRVDQAPDAGIIDMGYHYPIQ